MLVIKTKCGLFKHEEVLVSRAQLENDLKQPTLVKWHLVDGLALLELTLDRLIYFFEDNPWLVDAEVKL